MNAGLAVAMLRHQDRLDIPPSALSAAMGWADWPARLQRLVPGPLTGNREVWLDGGHNPSASRQIAAFVRREFSDGKPLHLIFASLATKDPPGMLEPFKDIAAQIHAIAIPGHESFAPDQLVETARSLGFPADAFDGVQSAVAATSPSARVLIFGSLYLAGVVLAANGQPPD
jgi:dihydrofolate synthase/folylpolyglutamate synthase